MSALTKQLEQLKKQQADLEERMEEEENQLKKQQAYIEKSIRIWPNTCKINQLKKHQADLEKKIKKDTITIATWEQKNEQQMKKMIERIFNEQRKLEDEKAKLRKWEEWDERIATEIKNKLVFNGKSIKKEEENSSSSSSGSDSSDEESSDEEANKKKYELYKRFLKLPRKKVTFHLLDKIATCNKHEERIRVLEEKNQMLLDENDSLKQQAHDMHLGHYCYSDKEYFPASKFS